MRILGVAAAIAALLGSAEAVPITYDLVAYADDFWTNSGQSIQIGVGTLTLDPAVTEDIWIGDSGPCQPGTIGDNCQFFATWTPISVVFAPSPFFGPYGNGVGAYLEGTIVGFSKGGSAFVHHGTWFDSSFAFDGVGIQVTPSDITNLLAGLGFFYCCDAPNYFGDTGGIAAGHIDVIPREVPLPAAAWLFIAGAGAIGFSAQRKRAQ